MLDKKILVSALLLFAILGGLKLGFDYKLPYLAAIALYIAIYFVVAKIGSDTPNTQPRQETQPEWPTSGPIGRFGQRGLVASFTASGLLCLLNPFQLLQIILQGAGNFVLQFRSSKSPVSAENYQNKARYQLPFGEEWLVYNGGITEQDSHSWNVLTQRYAYDFVIADENHVRHESRGTRTSDYFCYDKPILAAADGEVVKARDGVSDAPWLGYGVVDFLATNFIGNHLVIKHADGEFAVYAHLVKNSLQVAVGDRVEQGQVLARCGHTGHSSEPHLHFHLQDSNNFYFAMGLPITFTAIKVNGGLREAFYPTVGDRVRNQVTDN